MIVELPDKKMEIEFPDDMPHEAINKIIQEQFYKTKLETAPAPESPSAPFDATAASLGMFQPEELFKPLPTPGQAGKIALNQLPVLGAVGGGALGAASGLLTAGTTSLPGAAIGSGLGAWGGETARQAISQSLGLEPPASVKENIGNQVQQAIIGSGSALIPSGQGWMRPVLGGALTMGGGEAAKQAITGEADYGKIAKSAGLGGLVGAAGEGLGRGLDLFFGEPAQVAQKQSSQFVDWAKKNNLSYSLDAVSESPSAKAMQMSADYGPGVIISNWQRGKLIDKATQLSKTVNDQLGLPAAPGMPQIADDVVPLLQSLTNRKITHAQWRESMAALPENVRIEAQNTLEALEKIGGLPEIERIFQGKSGHVSRMGENLQRVIKRDGEFDKADLDFFINNLWSTHNKLRQQKDYTGITNLGTLKNAVMEDLAYTQAPGLNQTLKEVRTAADDLVKNNEALFSEFPLLRKLTRSNPDKRTGKLMALFSDANAPSAIAMRDKILLMPGGEDVWNAVQSSYLESIFSKTLTEHPAYIGQKVFNPNVYIEWFDKYGSAAGKIMPELEPALRQWYDISQGMTRDFQRRIKPQDAVKWGFKALIPTGGAGFLAGGPVGAVAIPGFATLASLFTMGPGKWGFIRNNLTKQLAPPISMGSREMATIPIMEGMEALK